MAGKEIQKPLRPIVKMDRLPEAFRTIINPEGWVNAILYRDKYEEPDPDFISKMLAAQSILAETIDDAWASGEVLKLQQWVLDRPGETTGPIEITDLYVAASDFETGNPCFVLVSFMHLESGETGKFSTGATNVQATLIGLLRNGVWPIRCQIKRGDSKDKGDRYLLHMLPPD
jgi:hypothetical protein